MKSCGAATAGPPLSPPCREDSVKSPRLTKRRGLSSCLILSPRGFHLEKKTLGGGGKDLVLPPDQIEPGIERGSQGAKAKGAVRAGVDQIPEGDHAAQALLGQNTAVIDQIHGSHHIQPVHQGAEPLAQLHLEPLTGADQGQTQQIGGPDGLLFGQGMVPAHDRTPDIRAGKFQVAVSGQVHRLHQNREIQQSPVQPFGQVLPVAAVQVDTDPGTALLEGLHLPGQIADAFGLGAADADVSAVQLVQRLKLLLGLVHHVQNVLGPLAEQHPLVGKADIVVAPDKELLAQLVFQVLQLPGQGGLGDVEPLGGVGDAALPGHLQKVEEIFEAQLRKCSVEYFDFYLFHNVCEMNIDAYLDDEKYGVFSYLMEQKKLGRIKHLGFSCHGAIPVLKRFLEAYGEHMEFCQLQLNYVDWTFQGCKEKVELLKEYNIPVWVMEPLRGGRLCSLPETARKALAALRPDETPTAWAFRFLQSIPQITVTLSGMSSFEQMKENIDTFSVDEPLSEKEMSTLLSVAGGMLGSTIPCTACHYCVSHCPQGLNIPHLLSLYNEHSFTGGGFLAPMALSALPEDKRPSACIGCRSCEAVCPQQIKISEAMAGFAAMLKG